MSAGETTWEINPSENVPAEDCKFQTRGLPVFPGFAAALSTNKVAEQIVFYDFSSSVPKVMAF